MFGKGWLQSTIIVSIVYGKKCNNEIISVVCHYVDVVIMYNSNMIALNVQFDPVAAFKMLSLSFHKEWVYTLFAETAPLMEVQRYKHFMWRCDKSMQRNQLWCLNRTVTGRLCDHSRTPLNSRHPWYNRQFRTSWLSFHLNSLQYVSNPWIADTLLLRLTDSLHAPNSTGTILNDSDVHYRCWS